ncbi:hypothetical protein [Pseudomonas sp. Fl4BN1]|uniref:hypothetical protein n=1 Tax=Pseudomonas sp. Fl4BN1 TaxID=2697651 RepID=UPI001C49BCF0|nr:hypothetical protein [Pseudomonas sp. Fl4BN1]
MRKKGPAIYAYKLADFTGVFGRAFLPLVRSGTANEVEVLRLQQRLAELTSGYQSTRDDYFVRPKDDFSKTHSELDLRSTYARAGSTS